MGYYTIEQNRKLVEEARHRVSLKPAKDVGVLFTYHHTREPVGRNFRSFIDSNPGAAVEPLYLTDDRKMLSFGCALGTNGFWKELTNQEPAKCWHNIDAAYYEYYRRRQENCKRWLLAEWDMFCSGRLEEYFGQFWNDPFVAVNLSILETGGDHNFFSEICNLPEEVKPFACASHPLAGTLISDECMEQIVLGSSWAGEKSVFCEVRIATLARMAGFKLSQRHFHGIRWRERPVVSGCGLWHPMKT